MGQMSEKGNRREQRYPGPSVEHEERGQHHAHFQAAKDDIRKLERSGIHYKPINQY